jgi:hypothetical protein
MHTVKGDKRKAESKNRTPKPFNAGALSMQAPFFIKLKKTSYAVFNKIKLPTLYNTPNFQKRQVFFTQAVFRRETRKTAVFPCVIHRNSLLSVAQARGRVAREEAASPQGSRLVEMRPFSPQPQDSRPRRPPVPPSPNASLHPPKATPPTKPRPPLLPQPGRSAAFPSHKRPHPSPKVTSRPNAASLPERLCRPACCRYRPCGEGAGGYSDHKPGEKAKKITHREGVSPT